MGKDLVVVGLFEVHRDRELVIIDVDEFDRIASFGWRPSDDARHDFAREGDVIDGDGRMRRRFLIRGDRPGARQTALFVGDVFANQHRDHAGGRLGLIDVDRGDRGVRERASHDGNVQQAVEHHVVGVAAAAGDEALVFLAPAGSTNFRADLGDGHAAPSSDEAPAEAFAAVCTALTMF